MSHIKRTGASCGVCPSLTLPPASNPSKSLDEYDVEMAQQANDFYEWAKSDPKLVGLAPWHWYARAHRGPWTRTAP